MIIRKVAKRAFAMLLVMFMLFGMAPAIHFDNGKVEVEMADSPLTTKAHAANQTGTISHNISGLTATYTYNDTYSSDYSFSVSGTTLTGWVQTDDVTEGEGCSATHTYTQLSSKLTLKNTSGNAAVLSFSVTKTLDGGTISQSGITDPATYYPASSLWTVVLNNNASISFTLTSKKDESSKPTIVISSIQLSRQSINTTFSPASNGSFTVDGEAITASSQKTKLNTETYTLVATPDAGYGFTGWKKDGVVISYLKTFTYRADSASTITPSFAADPLYSIATVSGGAAGKTKADYVEIDSFFDPSGYSTAGASSYHGSAKDAADFATYQGASTTDNVWKNDTYENLHWTTASATQITASKSGEAKGDPGGGTAGSAKSCARVLQIKALEDIGITFNYSVQETFEITSPQDSSRHQNAFFYAYKTSSSAYPTLSDIKTKGTRYGADESAGAGINDGNNSFSGTFSDTLFEGEYLYLYFYGHGANYRKGVPFPDSNFDYSFNSSVSDFVISPVSQSYTFQTGSIDGAGNLIGSKSGRAIAITYNSIPYNVGSDGLISGFEDLLDGQHISLSVSTVPSGYTHIGWRIIIGETTQDIFQEEYEFNISSDSTVYALFSPTVTVNSGGSNGFSAATYQYTTPSGSSATGANQYIARSSDGTNWYKSISEAYANESTIVLVTNVIFAGTYDLESGKTLSIPYSMADVAETTLQRTAGSGGISKYISATISGSMTINGNLVASARQSVDENQNGKAFGKVGFVEVTGTATVNSTGRIYAYGIVEGAGSITVKPDGIVYELLDIRDLRNAYGMIGYANNDIDSSVIPFNCYYVNNNLVNTTYQQGAKLIAIYHINITGFKESGTAPIIGPYSTDNSSLFMIRSGSITKKYFGSGDDANKIRFLVDTNSTVETGKFVVSATVNIMGEHSLTIDTSQRVLPLNAGYCVEVADGGSLTLNSAFKLLPGAKMKVNAGGNLTIASGAKLVLYRANDYDYRSKGPSGGERTGFTTNGYMKWFTYPSGISTGSASLGSAKLVVDGTLTCNGGLYVTNQLVTHEVEIEDPENPDSTITETRPLYSYSNGYHYLMGTGMIVFGSNLSNATIHEQLERAASGTDTSASEDTTVAITAIKGITVYDTATDDGQTNYNSLTQGTWYGYINDSSVNVWSTNLPATLSYAANGGSGDGPAAVRKPANTDLTVADNTFTAPTNKAFIGWSTIENPESTDDIIAAGDPISIATDTTLYAQWKGVTYTLNFNYSTSQLNNGETVTTQKTGAKIKYVYDGSIAVPKIQYYTLDHWTLTANNKTTPFTGETKEADLSSAIKALIDDGAKAEDITVEAFFVRKTYTLNVYSSVNGTLSAEPVLTLTCSAGRSIWINASKDIDGIPFRYWKIGADDADFSAIEETITDIKTSYFDADGSKTIRAIAYYTTDGQNYTTVTTPQLTVRDYFTEPYGSGYVVGMTLEVIAPTDTSGFAIVKDSDNKYQVGFRYTVDKTKADAGNFGTKTSGGWQADWTSGTYVMRFPIESADTNWYSYGFLEYTLNGSPYTRYATYKNPDTGEYVDYDTVTSAGLSK